MKTVMVMGLDNQIFSAADMLNPKQLKLIGYATTMEDAWNIYDESGNVKEMIEEMPIMPVDAAVSCEPDLMILAASNEDDDTVLKHMLFRADYRGEVISLFEQNKDFSIKTAVIRKLSWRLEELGVKGAIADLGAYRGDISWQLNALMPDRELYLFDTQSISERTERNLLARMPYQEQVKIRMGRFPETAYDLEEANYALVHIDTDLYDMVYSGMQYFFPRMSKGGVILVSGYENGKHEHVRCAIRDLELKYGAFLMMPLADSEGSIVIMRP